MRDERSLARGRSYVGLTLLVFMLALANATFPSGAKETPGVNIENFGKVNDHYYRGSQPGQAQLEQLKRLGVKTIIDLRQDREPKEPEQVRSLGMQYFNIPLKASRPATEEQTNYFLSLVNNSANWPVYVHCKGGRHRTGALTAVYRITHDGWTADQAWREMRDYDFNNGLFGGPGAQKKYVYDFYERYTARNARR
ncbi:MAG TPA: tyrosine-protein phosphatase [Pyrinomonadaceae bacterium]|jgi:protein tyrosine/serine phosphatase